MRNDEKWMKIAIKEAISSDNNEIPVGCVLIKDNKIIAKGHNQSISNNDPTAHAEIQVLRAAGKIMKNYRLKGTVLYVTLEPCSMCYGAISHARVDRLVFGAFDHKTGACGSCFDLSNSNCFNHKINISGGILKGDCSKLLIDFFKLRR
jgi:tRNA(adenine34) deaminase